MGKLEDIPKRDFFNTPEGYFETLPGRVQARLEGEHRFQRSPVVSFSLRYALPVVLVVAAAIFWFTSSNKPADVDKMLSAIKTEDLVAYLDESEITTDEVIESGNFSTTDIHEIEGEVYDLNMTNEDLKNIADDLD